MNSQYIKELEEELSYLYNKKSNYGWTSKDADRAEYLENILR